MAQLNLAGTAHQFELTFMDNDGVIFDVNAHKVRAFEEAVAPYPEAARQQLLAYHAGHAGMSRYEKIRVFFTEMHPVEDLDAAIEGALARFSEISRRAYAEIEPRAEALTFAERMGAADSVFVVSGTDQGELREAFDHHQLRGRFADVLGSPASKRHHIKTTLYERGIPATRALMVGDGRTEWKVARDLGMPFVFLREMSRWSDADEHFRGDDGVFVAETWQQLLGWLDGE